MNAITSLSSFNSRVNQGATLPYAQQAQRGTFNSGVGSVRGSSNTGASSTYCPTCAGGSAARGAATSSSSYCPTCNQAGGRQANITNAGVRAGAAQTGSAHNLQGGRICVGCAYQGR